MKLPRVSGPIRQVSGSSRRCNVRWNRLRGTSPHAVRTMLEIRPAREGFIVFDTDEQEAIMRFKSRDEAADLVVVTLSPYL